MKKPYFIGRSNELSALNRLASKKSASLVVIRGRRRIGKSRLVEEFAKDYRFLRFSGLPEEEKLTAQDQRNEFSKQLSTATGAKENTYDDWSRLFSSLASEVSSGKVIILFDEISWMGGKDHLFLPKLKNAWDMEFKQNPELILILCGSVSSWIEQNILNSTGFVGRLSLVLNLEELSLHESNQFLNRLNFKGDPYEKFKIFSVTGGVPRYLEEVDPKLTAEENIKHLCFTKSGILFREFNDIFSDIFSSRTNMYRKIVESLVSGRKEVEQIADYLGIKASSHLSKYLDDLLISGFIRRDYTWTISKYKPSRLSQYRLSDNYLRFYLKYIEPNRSKIESGHFNEQSIINLPGSSAIMGFQFENLVLNNRKLIWKELKIYPEDIVSDNPYFQRKQTRKKACQVDYMIQLKTNVLFACEIKFYKGEIKRDIIEETKTKLETLFLPRGFSVKPVLIHVNGVADSVIDEDYYYRIIDFGKDLL